MTNNDFMKALNDIDDELITSAKPLADKPIMVKPVKKSHWKSITAAAACAAVVAAGAIAVPKLVKMSALSGRESSGVQSASFGLSEETARVFGKDKNKAYPDDIEFELEEFPDIGFKCSTNGLIMRENDTEKLIGVDGENLTDVFLGDVNLDSKREILLNYKSDHMYSRIFDAENGILYQLNDPAFNCLLILDDDLGTYDDEETALLGTMCIEQESYPGAGSGVISLVFASPDYPVYGWKRVADAGSNDKLNMMEDLFNNELPMTVFMEGLREKDDTAAETVQVTYNGKTYNIVDTITENGVKFSIGLTKNEYNAGEYVEVLGIVENNTGKDIGLQTPLIGEDTNTEILMFVKQLCGDFEKLYNVDVSPEYDDSEGQKTITPGSHLLKSGETYYQAMRFDTRMERIEDENTIIPLCYPLGEYYVSAEITLLSDPNDKNSVMGINFLGGSLSIVQPKELQYYNKVTFTMDEFGDEVEFKCSNSILTVNDGEKEYDLFRFMPIDNLYLLDLNHDGKREICANVTSPSSGYKRIVAYDYANRKLYDLSDPGYYDYRMSVTRDIDGSYNVIAEKYRYSTDEKIGQPFPVIPFNMKAIEELSDAKREPVKGVREITEFGESFTMEEWPKITFHLDREKLDLFNQKGGGFGNELFTDKIDRLFLYDMNDDGKREIIIDGYHDPSIYKTGDELRPMIYAIDLDNNFISTIEPNKDLSLAVVGDDLYMVIDGKTDPKPLTFERIEELNKSPDI